MGDIIKAEKERAILVGLSVGTDRWETEDHLEELALLADTAGAEVIEKVIQERSRIDAAYFIGRGKAEQIAEMADAKEANLLIFDDDLSSAQMRNLEKLFNRKVLDRSGLILDIFARRAKTSEACTQVELAQLNYLLPRLTRQWTHLSRQVGGIGARGPGETQLEVDRRLIRKRIAHLEEALDKIKRQRDVRRKGREETLKLALVGYTNAGKSTLLNALTESNVFVEDRLFATLDPTIRQVNVEGLQDVILIDTVGFIRKLPHNLVASFKSTLEEAAVADILLHVVDVTHPMFFDHISVVNEVLRELKISDKPMLFIFNKIDALKGKSILERLKNEYENCVFISAAKQLFLPELKKAVAALVQENVFDLKLRIGVLFAETIAKIYQTVEVSAVEYGDEFVEMEVKAKRERVGILKRILSPDGVAHGVILNETDLT